MSLSSTPEPAEQLAGASAVRTLRPSRRVIAKGAAWAVPAAAVMASAPAFAASPTPNYSINSSWFSSYGTDGTSCTNTDLNAGGSRLERAGFSNDFHQWANGAESAPGFAGINRPASDGNLSETTAMTLNSYSITIYYPKGMIIPFNGTADDADNQSRTWNNGFGYNNTVRPQDYWSGPVLSTESLPGNGTTMAYDGFTFTWKGAGTSNNTVNLSTTEGTATRSWPKSNTLVGAWWVNKGFCIPPQMEYAVKIDYSFTTANNVSRSSSRTYWTVMRPRTS